MELKDETLEIAIAGARRIYAVKASPSMQKAAENSLWDAFFCGFDEAHTGLKNAWYHFVESVLRDMARKVSLDDMFDQILKRLTKSTSFMDGFADRAVNSPRFVQIVPKFARERVKHHVEHIKKNVKMTDNAWTMPKSPWSSSRTPDEEQYRKHAKYYRAETKHAPRNSQNLRKDQ